MRNFDDLLWTARDAVEELEEMAELNGGSNTVRVELMLIRRGLERVRDETA